MENGDNLLMISVQLQQLDISKLIIQNASNLKLEDKNFDGDTILMMAVMKGQSEFVRYLVHDKKMNVNAKENEGHTPFMAACSGGYLDLVQFFVMETKSNVTSREARP